MKEKENFKEPREFVESLGYKVCYDKDFAYIKKFNSYISIGLKIETPEDEDVFLNYIPYVIVDEEQCDMCFDNDDIIAMEGAYFVAQRDVQKIKRNNSKWCNRTVRILVFDDKK